MTPEQLPPLPRATVRDYGRSEDGFTAGQMHAYATAATAALRAEMDALRRERESAPLLLTALIGMVALAEYWFSREDRRAYSDDQFKTWFALGYKSNAFLNARAAIDAAMKETL